MSDIAIRLSRPEAFLVMMLLFRENICPEVAKRISDKLGVGQYIPPFGRFIRNVRIKNECTLLEMARSLNLTPAELCAMELGKEEMPPHIYREIQMFFDMRNYKYDFQEFQKLALENQKRFNDAP